MCQIQAGEFASQKAPENEDSINFSIISCVVLFTCLVQMGLWQGAVVNDETEWLSHLVAPSAMGSHHWRPVKYLPAVTHGRIIHWRSFWSEIKGRLHNAHLVSITMGAFIYFRSLFQPSCFVVSDVTTLLFCGYYNVTVRTSFSTDTCDVWLDVSCCTS